MRRKAAAWVMFPFLILKALSITFFSRSTSESPSGGSDGRSPSSPSNGAFSGRNLSGRRRKVLQGHFIAIAEDHHPLAGVLQFPDVAGPGAALEFLHDPGRHREIPALRQFPDEVQDELGNVFRPFPQRGNVYFDHVKAVVKILPEASCPDPALQVLVRRGDDPRVHGNGRIPAYRIHHLLLKGP